MGRGGVPNSLYRKIPKAIFFCYQEGQRLVFREGRTKAVGNVTQVIPHNPVGLKDQKGHGQKGSTIDSHAASALLAGDKSAAKAARNEQRNSRSGSAAVVQESTASKEIVK